MSRRLYALQRIGFEVLGLTALVGLVIVIAAYHYFDGLGFQSARAALFFSLTALFLSALPVQLYIVIRLGSLTAINAALFEAATQDGLTGLLNRRTFRTSVETAMLSLGRRRADDQVLTLLIVDADHFKSINDRLGHGVGDRALKLIATTLKDNVRVDDIVGRMGGEEFGILLRNAGAPETKLVAERLRLAVNVLSVGPVEDPIRLSVSLGAIAFAQPLPFDVIYRAADENLYRAKRRGRNRLELTDAVKVARREGDNRGATAILARGTRSALPAEESLAEAG